MDPDYAIINLFAYFVSNPEKNGVSSSVAFDEKYTEELIMNRWHHLLRRLPLLFFFLFLFLRRCQPETATADGRAGETEEHTHTHITTKKKRSVSKLPADK